MQSNAQEQHTIGDLRQIILYPGEDGFWVVECLSLPGCNSQGLTKEEAIANIKEAIELYLEVFAEGESPTART